MPQDRPEAQRLEGTRVRVEAQKPEEREAHSQVVREAHPQELRTAAVERVLL